MHIRYNDDPTLDAADRDCAGRRAGFVRVRGSGVGFAIALGWRGGGRWGGLVDVHLFGSHDERGKCAEDDSSLWEVLAFYIFEVSKGEGGRGGGTILQPLIYR